MSEIIHGDGPCLGRRHFLGHLLASSACFGSAAMMLSTMRAHAQALARDRRAAILLWLGGGPSSIDMWDLKPQAPTGGPFRPISTRGDMQICEHLPQLADCMDRLAIVRSMNTREADHTRGQYFMHTAFPPAGDVQHPSYGAVVAHELQPQRPQLQLPPFVSIGGDSVGPGFLGMTWSPLVVRADGRIPNLQPKVDGPRFARRLQLLGTLESNFNQQNRGSAATDHAAMLTKSYELMTTEQLAAFDTAREPRAMHERYGQHDFGQGCLLARRLIEAGVPFVEVSFDGWDNHQNVFTTLQQNLLPRLDQSFSALVEDLTQRGLWDRTVVICMGEFGRTPRINGNAGRDHFARAWSVVLGGGGIQGGRAIGGTNDDGTQLDGPAYSSPDLMASVCHALGISLNQTFITPTGRPIKIAGGGGVIQPLFG